MNRLSRVVVGAILTVFLGYVLVARSADIRSQVAVRDSIAYWTAGRLLLDHQNPYDKNVILELERQQGYQGDRPLVLRTPPWSLFMIVPLGFLAPLWAWLLWLTVCVACLLLGMQLCWKLYGSRNAVPQNLFSLVGYTFAPVPACLVAGQMGLVLMLGLVLFLWWEAKHPFAAGAALILPFAKPHLLSLFWFAFLFWMILRRKREVALGFTVTFTAAVALALFLDPRIFPHYRQMLETASIEHEFIPALTGVIRLIFFRRMFWVQFVPMVAGLIWCSVFFFPKLSTWSWQEHGPTLFVVSVLTTPYSWLADEAVLLPAVLQAAAFAYQARSNMKLRSKIAFLIFGLLNALLLLILKAKIPFATGIYFWSSLVWFSYYLHGRKLHERTQVATGD